MIDFSRISQNSLIGKFLRKILKLIPKNCVLPILQGKLRGKKWIIGSGVFSYWLGSYELEKQKIFVKMLKLGDVVYDIGAHVGFYSLLASKLVGDKGIVYSFEPNPQNAYFILRHIQLNKIGNVKLFMGAVGENFDLQFLSDEGPESKIKGGNSMSKIIIPIFSLDDVVFKYKIILPPNVLKIDVEGFELKVIKGAEKVIREYKPKLFIALDNKDTKLEIYKFIKNLEYVILNLNLHELKESEIYDHNEIVCLF